MNREIERNSQMLLRNASAKVRVTQILARKPQGVWTVAASATVFEAIHTMADRGVGALPVIDNGGIVGIVSERDFARKIILSGKSPLTTTVRDVMSTELVTVTEQTTVEKCMALMSNHRIRHLPVIDNGSLIGIVSIGDVVLEIIVQQQQTLGELERYISG
jgi:CBS domain-containing protein